MEKEEMYDIFRSIIDIHKQNFIILKSEIENMIKNKIKDEKYIQRRLDELLDILLFYENEDSLLAFRRLCRYYFTINPEATVNYINYYREQNEPEGIKFGKSKEKANL